MLPRSAKLSRQPAGSGPHSRKSLKRATPASKGAVSGPARRGGAGAKPLPSGSDGGRTSGEGPDEWGSGGRWEAVGAMLQETILYLWGQVRSRMWRTLFERVVTPCVCVRRTHHLQRKAEKAIKPPPTISRRDGLKEALEKVWKSRPMSLAPDEELLPEVCPCDGLTYGGA